MRVIITGGTGLIGRALASRLLAGGCESVVLSRRPEHATLPDGVRVCAWDACSADGWEELIETDTAIVNLAGENVGAGKWTRQRKERIRRSRIDAGQAVLAAVEHAACKPRVVIQASAVGYYGPCGDRSVIESQPAGDDFLARIAAAAEASTAAVQSLGVRWVAMRTGVVLSRDGGALPTMLRPFRLGLGGRLGNGRQWFPWIHIEDVLAAVCFLLDNESAAGAFNVTSFDPVRNRHFTSILARTIGRPALFRVPAFVLRILLGEMSTMLLTGQRAVPRRLLEMGFRFRFPDPGGALCDLLGPGASERPESV
jgi:uncharacterized protein